MKRILLTLLVCAAYMTVTAWPVSENDNFAETSETGLPLGYVTPWTGKTLFNPERHARGEWPVLCDAAAGDVYTVTLPYATGGAGQALIHFCTPISLQTEHAYVFSMKLNMTAGGTSMDTKVTLAESNDSRQVASATVTLTSGTASTVELNIASVAVSNLKLTLDAGGNSANTVIELSDISLRDATADREIWQGSVFYNLFYYSTSNGRRTSPYMSGTTPSMAWTLPDFDDSMWDDTVMPVGNVGYMSEVKTVWPGDEYNNYWIRRTFDLDRIETTNGYTVRLCHDDAYTLYVNGHFIAEGENWTEGKNTENFDIPVPYLQVGKNVIAICQKQNYGGKFFDCGLTITPNVHEHYDTTDLTGIVVNEVMVGNIDEFIDYSFNYGAWIELYNPTSLAIYIGSLCFSDDLSDLKKAALPEDYGVIKPGEYKVVYFDHNASAGEYGKTANRQIGFKLNDEGGTLYISNREGTLVIEQAYPASVSRCSYARRTDGGSEWAFTGDATPGASNNTSGFATQRLDAPTVSHDSQLFAAPFSATVSFPDAATLHYTTDGSAPTKDSPVSLDGRFDVSATTTLRLRLFQDGMLPSSVVTRSYIYRDKDYYLPVIAISTDSRNLYDDNIGIYCQGTNGVEGHGGPGGVRYNLNMDWERPVNVEYITPEGKMVINQEAEMSISGGWSRLYAPASFKLKARNLYDGQKQFNHQFFAAKPYNKYKTLLVRNGGNDNDSQEHGRIKDGIIQQTLLSSGIYVDCQDMQPTHVFFNGQYIGMLNLREPSNKYFGTANYGYDKDEMDAFEYSNGYFQKAGDDAAFREWVNLSGDVADETKYQELCEKVDMDEFANYMAAITYIGSSDWICNNNNAKGFRSRPDGKFHMVVFDVDWGFRNASALAQILDSNANDLIRIFKNSLASSAFKRQFVDAYCLMGGSVFTPGRSKAIADSLAALMAPALDFEGKQPWTSYKELVPYMTSESERATRITTLRQRMGLGKGMKLKLRANIDEAQLRLNGHNVPLAEFDGTAFAPFILEASAPAGYNFVGWADNDGKICHGDRVYEITGDKDATLTAVFEPLGEEFLTVAGVTPVVVNEVSAANSVFANDYNKRNDWVELYNTTDMPVDVSGMYLSDNADKPTKYQITNGGNNEISTVIPPHGYLVVWADKDEPLWQLHASFKLGNDDGECVVLTAQDGSWNDILTYKAHTGEESVGRYPDGGKRVFHMSRPTIATRNQLTTCSEWLYGEDVDFDTSGISTAIPADIAGSGTEYYTLDGRRVASPQRGITIVRITQSDGCVVTRKVAK